MPNRCCVCDIELSPERIIALIDNTPLDQMTCIEHGRKTRPIGFMGEASDPTGNIKNVGRKGGYVLTILDPEKDPNFKENLRRAIRVHNRAR